MIDFENEIGLEIPAYLRGELSAEDMARIDALAAKNPEIAADIEFQRNLMSAVKSDGDDSSASEFGWARLSKAMNADGPSDIELPQILNDNAKNPIKFWRIAAAALAVIGLGQAGYIASNAGSTVTDDARYEMVTDNAFDIDVLFHDDAPQMLTTKLLQDVQGELVSGPNAGGLYKVQFETKNMCQQAVKAFTAASKVVNTASKCD